MRKRCIIVWMALFLFIFHNYMYGLYLSSRNRLHQNGKLTVSTENDQTDSDTIYQNNGHNTDAVTEQNRGENEQKCLWLYAPTYFFPKNFTGCKHYFQEEICVEKIFPNTHDSRNSTTNDVTLVTHSAIDRIDSLQRLLTYWTGPLTVTIFMNLLNGKPTEKHLEKLQTLIQMASERKHLKILIARGDKQLFYPQNALMDISLLFSNSQYYMHYEIDFVPSINLYEDLVNDLKNIRKSYSEEDMKHMAFVVPAFETDMQYSKLDHPNTKPDVLKLLQSHQIWPMRAKKFPPGHSKTNYRKWSTSSEIYMVGYQGGYEPFMLLPSNAPLPDPHYTAIHKIKQHLVHAVYHLGYNLTVLPNMFMIHYPHPKNPQRVGNYARDDVYCGGKVWVERRYIAFTRQDAIAKLSIPA